MASLPAFQPLRRVADRPGYAEPLALYRPLAAVVPRHPQFVWNWLAVSEPGFWRGLAEIYPCIFLAPTEVPDAIGGACDALCLAVTGPDSFARPDGNLRCEIVVVAWLQVKRDVPMLAVLIVFPARIFAYPYAGPMDAAMDNPLSQQF